MGLAEVAFAWRGRDEWWLTRRDVRQSVCWIKAHQTVVHGSHLWPVEGNGLELVHLTKVIHVAGETQVRASQRHRTWGHAIETGLQTGVRSHVVTWRRLVGNAIRVVRLLRVRRGVNGGVDGEAGRRGLRRHAPVGDHGGSGGRCLLAAVKVNMLTRGLLDRRRSH